MAHNGKIAAITDFVKACGEHKLDMREDAEAMLLRLPFGILGDAAALTAFMEEMLDAVIEKHVITPEGKIRPRASAMIRRYVDGVTVDLRGSKS